MTEYRTKTIIEWNEKKKKKKKNFLNFFKKNPSQKQTYKIKNKKKKWMYI